MNHPVSRRIAITGIVLSVAYIGCVAAYITTQQRIFLEAMELMTISAALYVPFLIGIVVSSSLTPRAQLFKTIALLCAAACMVLSVSAHFVNLSVTNVLIDNGSVVADYMRIGQRPSIEMAIDYLAWGLFLGISFITAGASYEKKPTHRIKIIAQLSGLLCLIGFIGSLWLEPLWFIAVTGYVLGIIMVCVEILRLPSQNPRDRIVRT